MQKKQKPKTKGYWVKKFDQVFSTFIRKKYADHFGMVGCYTCHVKKHYKDMQNGHYISRGHMTTRWDEENCRVQCVGCNVFRNGNYTEYSYRLLKEIGAKGLDKLMAKKKEIKQWSIKEIQEKIAYYEKLI